MVEYLHKLWHYPFVWAKHLAKGPAVILLGILFILVGIIFVSLSDGVFWVAAIGFPLILGGASFIIYGIYDLIFGIFSLQHQLTDCPFCGSQVRLGQNQVRIKTKEEVAICKNCGNKVRMTKAAKPKG